MGDMVEDSSDFWRCFDGQFRLCQARFIRIDMEGDVGITYILPSIYLLNLRTDTVDSTAKI